ncbi:MAG: FecR family protein [Dongiaceae bacterium]
MTCARRLRIDLFALALAAWVLPPRQAVAEEAIGAARIVVAEVSAQSAAASRRLATSDEVRYRELIATAESSAAVIVFVDATGLAIGEQARIRLDEFVFNPGSAGKLDLTLEFGALRFSTGSMAKPAYKIVTPSATLAVRGTEFDLAVAEDGATYLTVRHGQVAITGGNGESKLVGADQSVTVSTAGTPSEPRIAAVSPVGALPDKIAAMDLALAGALADAADDGLGDLSVLAKARSLHSGARPDLGRPGKPGKGPDKDKKPGGPGPL